ncbi:MAG TPA: hypothetical protein VHL58_08385 [Thermoanaerobaculia bacterium]|nr:hypothetical protein [Thermoanaerobaculia bacterium]
MIEILLAAFVPCALAGFLAVAARDVDLRRATLFWFIPLTLLWFSPCWLTGSSPAAFDYLAQDLYPWKALVQNGFRAGNALLSDPPLQFIPWREVARISILHGEMPYLNPFAGAGSILWANPQAAVLFPLTLLGLPFSSFAWPLFSATAKVLCGLMASYLFLRSESLSQHAAIFGAISYGFCAFTIAFLLFPHTNVTVLLPLLLWGIVQSRRSWRGAAAFAVILFVMLIGGHPESVVHIALLAIPFAVARAWGDRAALRRIFAGGLVGCALAGPALIPFAATLRTGERLERIERQRDLAAPPHLTVANLAGFIAPALLSDRRSPDAEENFNEVATQYVGVIAFILAIVAIVREARRLRFWWVSFLCLLPLAFRSPLLDSIPLVNLVMNGRIRVILGFIVAVLAAQGFDAVIRKRVWRLALPLLAFADLALLLVAYNTPVAPEFYYAATPGLRFLASQPGPLRFCGVGGVLLPNTGAMWRLEDVGVHDPVAFEQYLQLLERGGYDRRFYFNLFHRIPPRPLLDLLDVRYVVAPPGYRSSALPLVYRGSDVSIYFNRDASAIHATSSLTFAKRRIGTNHLSIAVKSVSAGEMWISQAGLPGWSLLKDGRHWPLTASPLLRWRVPPGPSTFELSYLPPGLSAGCWLFALAGAALLLMLVRPSSQSE